MRPRRSRPKSGCSRPAWERQRRPGSCRALRTLRARVALSKARKIPTRSSCGWQFSRARRQWRLCAWTGPFSSATTPSRSCWGALAHHAAAPSASAPAAMLRRTARCGRYQQGEVEGQSFYLHAAPLDMAQLMQAVFEVVQVCPLSTCCKTRVWTLREGERSHFLRD